MRILIVQTGFLGDVVLTTPLMESLRTKYPTARFTWVTTPEAAPLLEADPWVEAVVPFDKRRTESGLGGLWRKARQLRAQRFDFACGVQRSWRTAMLLALAGINPRIGFAESSMAALYTRRLSRARPLGPGTPSHEVERNLALLEETRPLRLRLITEPPSGAGTLWGAQQTQIDPARCVVLGVGSAWATKRWTVGGFIETARAIAQRGLVPVILGGAADQARAALVTEEVPEAINLELPLDQSVRFVSGCAAVVCHDSLLLHIASAFARPTVAIFCSTVPEFGFGPWCNESARVVQTGQLACRPCGRHGHALCPTGTWACSLEISGQQVINALDSLLSGSKSSE